MTCRKMRAGGLLLLAITVLFSLLPAPASAQAKTKVQIAWSIYVGWMPWPYAAEAGILKKWGDKYGVDIELVQLDYIPSIEAYVGGKVAGCLMTNMEALDMPAAGGIDSTVIIMGDFSNGNDGVLLRGGTTVKDLKGKPVNLVELSVSHYLLVRALEQNQMKESDVKIVNTSDSDIAPTFLADPKIPSIVTWNPLLMQARQAKGANLVFDSSKIPGEIMDLMVVKTDVLQKNPGLAKALAGAWYETMTLMSAKGAATDKAIAAMAEKGGSTLAEFKAQLETTQMYYKPADASAFCKSDKLKTTMDSVRKFCASHKLLGNNVSDPDVVGIALPGGAVLGKKENVKLRFTTEYMDMAAAGGL
ncbi:MAG: putative urea ABC transporter substrate-binding protein [Acidobacteriota bacterium]